MNNENRMISSQTGGCLYGYAWSKSMLISLHRGNDDQTSSGDKSWLQPIV